MNGSIYGYLVVFHTIIIEGSIAAAARKLEVASPSVSQSLKSLEQYIGLPLINRTTRKMELTDAGQRLFDSTLPLVQSLHFAVEEVRDLSEMPCGKLRITLSDLHYYSILQPHYAEFCQRYPQVLLEISINNGMVDILQEGFDVGIRMGDRLDEHFVARKLTETGKMGFYVSKSYAQQYGVPKTLAELKRHKQVGFRFTTSNKLAETNVYDDDGKQLTLDIPLSIITNNMMSTIDAVEQGMGIGRIFSLHPCTKHLVPVLPDYWIMFPPSYLFYLQHSQKAKRVKVFIDFLLEKMAQHR